MLNFGKIGKAIGGLVAAGGGTTAIAQMASASNPKVGTAIMTAGVALHGASTAYHEYAPKIAKAWAAIKAAKAVLQEADPQPEQEKPQS